MSKTTNQSATEEIDLGYFFDRISVFLKTILKFFFKGIDILFQYKIVVVVLILLGVAYGYYKDLPQHKKYVNELIVIPNFESVDYLYSQVNALNKKRELGDTIYLKSVLGSKYRYFKGVEAEPIIDVYGFASRTSVNLDVLRMTSQNHDFTDAITDINTSKRYKYHKIILTTVGKGNSKTIINGFLDFINKNQHFNQYKDVSKKNTQELLVANEDMVTQIDSLIASVSAPSKTVSPTFQINDKSDLAQLVPQKQNLLGRRLSLLKQLKDETDIVKEISAVYDIKDEGKGFPFGNKLKYPLLFILLFLGVMWAIKSYRKLKTFAYSS